MEIMHRLQQSTSTTTCTNIGAGTGTYTDIGACTGTCTSTSDQDADYHLTVYGLVRFKDMIYVPNYSELKDLILREFHVKPYSGHL